MSEDRDDLSDKKSEEESLLARVRALAPLISLILQILELLLRILRVIE
jgi:hypothetical protein